MSGMASADHPITQRQLLKLLPDRDYFPQPNSPTALGVSLYLFFPCQSSVAARKVCSLSLWTARNKGPTSAQQSERTLKTT
jgi:hypothetical protein